MTKHQPAHADGFVTLCDPPYRELLLVPVERIRENPAFPVNEGYEAYTTIAECRRLVYQTIGHIGRLKKFVNIVTPTVNWSDRIDARGQAQWYGKSHPKGLAIEIRLNPIIFYYDTPANRAQTVIHEACHAGNYLADDINARHGPKWVELMNWCEVPAEEYGSVPPAFGWHGKCPKCGGVWFLRTASDYFAVQNGSMAAMCRNCGGAVFDVSNAIPPTAKPFEWKKYMK